MSEPKHTPGPWQIPSDYPTSAGLTVWDTTGQLVAVVKHVMAADTVSSQCDANARLIAAAPELAEALQDLVAGNYGQPHGVTVPTLDKARAAIAKARGQ